LFDIDQLQHQKLLWIKFLIPKAQQVYTLAAALRAAFITYPIARISALFN
jgi:hypothetical protein